MLESASESESNPESDVGEVEEIVKEAKPAHQDTPASWILQATSDGRLFHYDTLTGNVTFELSTSKSSMGGVESGPELEPKENIDHGDESLAHLDAHDEVLRSWIPQSTQDGRIYYHKTMTAVSAMALP